MSNNAETKSKRPVLGSRVRITALTYGLSPLYGKKGTVVRHAEKGRGIYVRIDGASLDKYISQGWEALPTDGDPV